MIKISNTGTTMNGCQTTIHYTVVPMFDKSIFKNRYTRKQEKWTKTNKSNEQIKSENIGKANTFSVY